MSVKNRLKKLERDAGIDVPSGPDCTCPGPQYSTVYFRDGEDGEALDTEGRPMRTEPLICPRCSKPKIEHAFIVEFVAADPKMSPYYQDNQPKEMQNK